MLGQGASGTVYLARRPGIERMFALKLLAADLDPEGRARVQREAQIASRLDHAGIVRVVDFGVLGPQLYIVMEHIPGPTLRDSLAQGSLPPERAADIVAQLADAMDVAHAAGVVHRDLKPANVILDARDDKPKVTDFGLARDTRATHQLTKPGEVIGTPYYMAPEQIHGGTVDARTDVYAMGVILYELLTGQRPFEGQTVAAVVHAILNAKVVAPRKLNPRIPPTLERVCLKALSRQPVDRYPTARALAQELLTPATLDPSPAAPAVPPAAAAVLGGLCAGLAVLSVWAAMAFVQQRGLAQPLEDAQAALTARQTQLRQAEATREQAQRDAERAAEEARRRLAQATQRVTELAPLRAEIARSATESTGHLALVVDALVRDLEAVEGTEAMRANLLYNRGRYAEVNQLCERARALGVDDPELAVVEFRASSRLGDRNRAERALRGVLQSHPDSLPALFATFFVEQRALSPDEFRALRQREDLRFNYFHNLELMALIQGQRKAEALALAREATAFDPSDFDAHYFLAVLLLERWNDPSALVERAELTECLHAYRLATELRPGDPKLEQLAPALQRVLDRYGRDPG
ncbi:MAG: serine/threonine protein kinase [Planctomycetes bacterium]|nr:serine/threonine protein kinase [Planctomycetota bacterium]